MKKEIIYFSAVWFSFGNTLAVGQINNQASFSPSYTIVDVILEDGNTYSRIEMPEMQSTEIPGYPLLPVKYLKFIIPANALFIEKRGEGLHPIAFRTDNIKSGNGKNY